MKTRFLLLTAFAALFAAGCGKNDTSAPAPAAAAAAPAPAAPAGPRTVEITANDMMKFSLASIEAKPGEDLKVILTNIGSAPKEAMGHNWVLLKKGTDVATFATAAMVAKATDYIPDALKDQVIVHTELLGPRKSGEVTFKAPTEPGEYPFLCTFPAHFQVGMKGVLIVK